MPMCLPSNPTIIGLASSPEATAAEVSVVLLNQRVSHWEMVHGF